MSGCERHHTCDKSHCWRKLGRASDLNHSASDGDSVPSHRGVRERGTGMSDFGEYMNARIEAIQAVMTTAKFSPLRSQSPGPGAIRSAASIVPYCASSGRNQSVGRCAFFPPIGVRFRYSPWRPLRSILCKSSRTCRPGSVYAGKLQQSFGTRSTSSQITVKRI